MLGEAFLRIVSDWRSSFARPSSFQRAVVMAAAYLCLLGRATTSRAIEALGRSGRDWSAEYRLCSQAPWEVRDLFAALLKESLRWTGDGCVVTAFDDTRLKKTGKKIVGAQYHRDPLSPAFRFNLIYCLRFLQCSVLLPLHATSERSARAVPISFEHAPCAKKPGKKAGPAQWEAYRDASRKQNLSVVFGQCLTEVRHRLDAMGANSRLHLACVDGSFCNRNCLSQIPERTVVLARARKDAKLCFAAGSGRRKVYGDQKFTPEYVLEDRTRPFKRDHFVFGGAERELKYKRVDNVLWQGGTKTRLVTLLVIAPTPYRNTKNGPKLYRNPAYLICTSTDLDSRKLIQAYLDRWQIEVNFHEEKSVLGVGQAQVWSEEAVPRQPALAVAAYGALILAALSANGPGKADRYADYPKWRKQPRRPSLAVMRAKFREEIADPTSMLNQKIGAPSGFRTMVMTAAA